MRPYIYSAVGIALMLTVAAGCSSTTVVQEKPTIPEVPEYVKVPHPVNFELGSLHAIFFSPLAPQDVQGEFSKTCDSEFAKLVELSDSTEERQKAAVELVTNDPERMHWCFYGKVSKLQETLQGDTTWSERQKKVFDTFVFISPLANAFLEVYHDSRYLRWASQYYSKISEWVFFRKVTPGPDTTLALVQGAAGSGLEPWIPVDNKASKKDSIFSKYGISLAPTVASGTNPLDHAVRVPASKEPEVTSAKPVKATEAEIEDLDDPADVPSTSAVPSTAPKKETGDQMIGY